MKRILSALNTVINEFCKASLRTFLESILLTLRIPCRFNNIYVLRNKIQLFHAPKTLDRMVIRECLINDLYTKYLNIGKLEVVVDLGSHKGFFIIGLLSKGFEIQKVICVEPLIENIEAFQKNKDLNQGLFGKIVECHIEQVAVSTEDGIATFHLTDNSVNHSLHDPGLISRVTEKRQVPTRTLSGILSEYHIDQIDLLKIDIEGTEFDLFQDAPQLDRILKSKNIIMEIHPDASRHASTLLRILENAGYRLHYPNPAFPDLVFARKL